MDPETDTLPLFSNSALQVWTAYFLQKYRVITMMHEQWIQKHTQNSLHRVSLQKKRRLLETSPVETVLNGLYHRSHGGPGGI